MNLISRPKTAHVIELRRPDPMKQALHQCFCQLVKSIDRYWHFKKLGAPDILVDAEKVLIRRRLLLLLNFRGERTK